MGFFMKSSCSNISLPGISSGECNHCGDRRSSFSWCSSWFPCAAYFDIRGSQAVKDASASRDKLTDLFSRIECFFRRLEIYTGITPTVAMRDIIVEIMVEVVTILGIATKELKRGRMSESISLRLSILDSHLA
jgi:hypothetical protein